MWWRLLLMATATLSLLSAQSWSGRVVKVGDGDTLDVLRGKSQVRVRLHGVDCPELGQPFGERARQRTGALAHGQVVTVREVERDRFGRVVAEVVLPGGESLNETLVKEGLAWWFRQYAASNLKLRMLEEEARDARRGLWADSKPVAPWVWRRSSGRK